MITQFPTPAMSMRKRDKIIQEACVITTESDAVIMQMAQALADRIPKLGVQSALRLLAAIGLCLPAPDCESLRQALAGGRRDGDSTS